MRGFIYAVEWAQKLCFRKRKKSARYRFSVEFVEVVMFIYRTSYRLYQAHIAYSFSLRLFQSIYIQRCKILTTNTFTHFFPHLKRFSFHNVCLHWWRVMFGGMRLWKSQCRRLCTHCREVEVYRYSHYLHVRYFVLSNAVVEVYECCGSFCFIFHTAYIRSCESYYSRHT